MIFNTDKIVKNIVTLSLVTMFFSCTNNSDEVKEFFTIKNSPIKISIDIYHVYKDSGRITSKMTTPLILDFSNRNEHPYNEFPKGLKLITFENGGKDSVTIIGNYALTYSKTMISELKDSVVIINHVDQTKLYTDQLFWDQNTDYFYSEKKFMMTTLTDTIYGVGFESKKDLTKFSARQYSSKHIIKEE